MANDRAVVQRYDIADYLNVGSGEEENYVLMGVGFTSLNESPGAQTTSKKYINEKTSSSSITSYETQFPFESDLIPAQAAVKALYEVGRNHLVGSDAEFDYVRVDLFDKVVEKENNYKARKFRVCAEVSEFNGEDDQVVSGNLNAVGDPIFGTFDTSTKKFTADPAPQE